MDAGSLLATFEAAPTPTRKLLLKTNRGVIGFAQCYFERLANLLGSNPTAAHALASDWLIVFRAGDDPAYAYRAKAVLERLDGQWDKSARSFFRSASLAVDPVSRISFQTGAIDSLARAGQTARAIATGRKIAVQLTSLGEPALAGRAWLNTGNACLWADRHETAKQCYTKAVKCLVGTPYRLEHAAALLGLSSASLYVDSPAKAIANAESARDEMIAIGATANANHAEVNLGHGNLLLGRPDEAVRVFTRLRAESASDSLEFARLSQFLGDALVELDMFEAALDAYQVALATPAIQQSPINQGNCHLGIGGVKIGQGKTAEAQKSFESARAKYAWFKNDALVRVAQLGLARTYVALGDLRRARTSLTTLAAGFRASRMNFYLAATLIELATISPEEALLAEAARLVRRNRYISLEWRIHALRASRLSDRDAKRHYRRMLHSVLAHRTQLSSVTAKLNLLSPCQAAIRRYLQILIDEHSAAALREAIGVIVDLRSVTLLDECVQATQHRLSTEQREVLNRIREHIERADRDQIPGGPLRRHGSQRGISPADLRTYIEQIGVDRVEHEPATATHLTGHPLNVFTLLQDGSAWIVDGKVLRLPATRDEIRRRIDWVHFELFAPLNGFESDLKRLDEEIGTLRQMLRVDDLVHHNGQLHPAVEDVAFNVPWNLLTHQRPILHLRPVAVADPSSIRLNREPKVAIWYHARPDLPHIEQEVESLRAAFSDVTVCQTVDEALGSARSEPYDLIHVAAHGRFDPDNPMFSSLQMKDGHLLASDIARSGVRARLVSLASCDSAQFGLNRNWEPQGLVRAFLATQAQIVIGSAWPLNDAISRHFFQTFYLALLRDCSVGESIQSAQADTQLKYKHPAHWAPFTMFGGYI